MALKCRCICGCKLLVASDSAGKRIKCPKCERKLRVPVDLVEKRRAQLEARKPSPPPTPRRSKIDKPLSSLVDLPEPEPPPIQLGTNEPITAISQHVEPTTSAPDSPAAEPPLLTPPLTTPRLAALADPVPAPPPVEPRDSADSPRKPPPLPKRSEDRAKTHCVPTDREAPSAPVDANVAPTPSPAPSPTSSKPDPATPTDDATKAPRLEVDDVELPVRGYEADRKYVATVRWLAAAVLLTGIVGMVPAIIDIVEHTLSESSEGLSRWACVLLLVGLLQCAYAVYLVQLPDWSSVWVVTIFTLAIAASYAAMFGLTLLSSDQGQFVQVLDLADRLRGGKATGWCLIMLSLMSLTSYFGGRVGVRWRNAFVG